MITYKIAVCLSGHMRSFKETYKNFFDSVVQHHHADFFIHTWTELGFREWENGIGKVDEEEIRSIYNPKLLVIEEENKEIRVDPARKMFTKVLRADELRTTYEKKTGTSYEFVVRARPDNWFKEPMNWYDVLTDKINLPKDGAFGGVNDQFAIAVPSLMEKYTNLVNCSGESFHPETRLRDHLGELVNEVHSMKTAIKRTNGYLFDYSNG